MNGNRNGTPQIDGGATATEGFGTVALSKSAETATTAAAAQAQAMTQARFIIAMKTPRDMDAVRLKIEKECRRPGFADVARYHKPIGKGVEGPSIRFAEAAVRCMGNIDVTTQLVYENEEQRTLKVTVIDFESNASFGGDVTVDKTVERSKVPDGMKPLSVRTNSYGKATYILPATDDDLLNKQNALVSKAVRTLAMRLIPGDLVDGAMEIVIQTQKNRDAQDPDAARKKLVDAFAGVGVKPGDLKTYLGHDLDTVSPAEMVKLRALFAAIRDGEATWAEALAQKGKGADGKAAEGLKDRVKAKAEAGKAAAAPPPPPPPADEAGDANDEYEPMTDEERAAAIDAGG